MPGRTGSRFVHHDAPHTAHGHFETVLKRQHMLSRSKTLKRLKQLLKPEQGVSKEALQLISLFHIQSDELCEAGVPYEMIRAVEKSYPLWLFE